MKILDRFDVIVVGGGAAGMMAAISAAEYGASCALVEKNGRLGKKLLITGKGRCNLTNNCDRDTLITNVCRNPRFLYSAFSGFDSADTMAFFERHGVPLKTERGNRVFPQSDRSWDVLTALERALRETGVTVITGTVSAVCIADGAVSGVRLRGGGELHAQKVILATGGVSYPATGSTGDGYRFAEVFGHHIVPPRPALVPVECPGCTELMGLSLRNTGLRLLRDGAEVYRDMGELLFTHFGLSGPMILSATSHMGAPGSYLFELDLKPALDQKQLDARVLRDFSEMPNRQFKNSLQKLLPAKLIPEVVRRSGIDPDKAVNAVTREERAALVSVLKKLTFSFERFRPIAEAIVTSGGVDVREVSAKTMESKLISGLYFAGELLDVDAYTGGFNLQIAFSTGVLAGHSAAMA